MAGCLMFCEFALSALESLQCFPADGNDDVTIARIMNHEMV